MRSLTERILAAQHGKTHLFSTGQAGFVLKSAAGQLLAIDLYLSDCVERLEGHAGFKRLLPKVLAPDDLVFDAVVCTHQHLDHFDIDAVPSMMANGHTRLFCSFDCRPLVDQLSLDYYSSSIDFVSSGDSQTVGDFRIDFVECDHGDSAPGAVGVVVAVDGKVIYETGDTCLRLDRVNDIVEHGPIDVLIAPINGRYGNMDEEGCAKYAKVLQPGVTVPCHYGMFASHHGDVGLFYEIMQEMELPSLVMSQGEKLTL